MKMLIADDDLTSRTMLSAVAKKYGYDPVSMDDGEAAWEILQHEDAPRLLLLDWEMPKLDGVQLCKNIREQKSDNPPYIILISGRTTTSDIVIGLDAGANDYISKPFVNEELLARLNVGKRVLSLQAELYEAREKLAFEATHDPLTSLLNRGATMQALDVEITRADRHKNTLFVAFIDIDHFKKVNDVHGHLAGDTVLREVSQRIVETIRPYDTLGRYGGEEFLLLLSNCEGDAHDFFERVRRVISDTPFLLDDVELTITISGGVAKYQPLAPLRDARSLLLAADEALYQSKNAGRNRITCEE